MHEVIDNQGKRQQQLKEVIRRLHDGATVEEVKGQFSRLLQDVGAGEIAALEQALIAEGLPEQEVKQLCDVHVAVFRDSLEEQQSAETIPGHPVHTFLAENRAAAKVLEAFSSALEALPEEPSPQHVEELRRLLAQLRAYEAHYLREENQLFPYLERKGFAGPSKVMWAIHDDVRQGWKALTELLEAGPGGDPQAFHARLAAVFGAVAHTTREMFYKEEKILYPNALQMLNDREWSEIRAQEPEIGYAYIQPGDRWAPRPLVQELPPEAAPSAPVEEKAVPAGGLDLRVGRLSLEELNLLFRYMPVDLTYVDEHDTVRFYSDTPERIFPRSPAVIGRRVQLCHPPTSVHRVQQILDDFRARRRDEAAFWIQIDDRFIHIRYFALRDDHDVYRGTLEVTQDITEIRTLEGERRLLDE